ncbi:hypothetical protein C8Q77DRAFT_883256 [Trametes polyzona]|nr:hypothetical protein C8Q77DRAFT_883256 [Trametes polyzona]
MDFQQAVKYTMSCPSLARDPHRRRSKCSKQRLRFLHRQGSWACSRAQSWQRDRTLSLRTIPSRSRGRFASRPAASNQQSPTKGRGYSRCRGFSRHRTSRSHHCRQALVIQGPRACAAAVPESRFPTFSHSYILVSASDLFTCCRPS